jgi:hypothetical protein
MSVLEPGEGKRRLPSGCSIASSPIIRDTLTSWSQTRCTSTRPFINFCLDRHNMHDRHGEGDHRLLLQDAQGLFSLQPPGCWVDDKAKRTVRYWDEKASPRARGEAALRVLHRGDSAASPADRRSVARDERDNDVVLGDDVVEGSDVDACAVAVRPWPLGHRGDCFNTLAAWGLDHCFKHAATAIVNFLLTSFIVCLAAELLAEEPQAGACVRG